MDDGVESTNLIACLHSFIIVLTIHKYIPNKAMFCKYCIQVAAGINYRPNTSLDNIPACLNHATSLFVPFSNPSTLPDKPTPSKLQELLQKLMDSIIAEFNLIKTEVLYHEEQMQKLSQTNAMVFRMNCQLTSPYIIIPADQELLLSTLIKRSKFRYEREKVESERNSLYSSRIVQNQTELLKSQIKPSTSKKYLFFTPQSTERSRLEGSNIKKSIVVPKTSIISERIKDKIDKDKA